MPASYINDQWVQQDSLGLGRGGDAVAKISNAGFLLDALLPISGLLWQQALACVPVDAWLLQGEGVIEDYGRFSQAVVLLALIQNKPCLLVPV